jgi:hypothetical protein
MARKKLFVERVKILLMPNLRFGARASARFNVCLQGHIEAA